jgi:hypothetical protein
MHQTTLSDLIGAGEGPVRWERPFLFALALFAGTLVWLVLTPAVGLASAVPSPWAWVQALWDDVALAGTAFVVLRFVRHPAVAVPVIAVASAALGQAAQALERSVDSLDWLVFAANVTWAGFVLGGIALGVRWIRPAFLGIWAGACAGAIANRVVQTFVAVVFDVVPFSFGQRALFTLVSLASTTVFAAVLWAGLRMASGDERPARISRSFYLGTLTPTLALACALAVFPSAFLAAGAWRPDGPGEAVPILLVLGAALALAVCGGTLFAILVYRMWAAIQDGHARTTPGRAVGLLFVPFFNVYWAFQVFPGYATDYNAYVKRHGVEARELSAGPFVAYVIACLVTFVPVVGLLAGVAAVALALVLAARVCDAINALPKAITIGGPGVETARGPVTTPLAAGAGAGNRRG